jgi:hypothetical protein
MKRSCIAFCPSRMALLLLLLGAASVAAWTAPTLDRRTGATIQVSRKPWVLALEQPQMAANARDYIALYAAEINISGTRRYHLAAFFWSTVPGRERFAGTAPDITLRVDDRVLHLSPSGKTPRDMGISQWPLKPPGRGALLVVYEVDTALLRQLAVTHHILARPDSDPTLPPDVWFDEWQNARGAFADFITEALGVR